MSMFTRCPHCDTVFRVTPQQLQVSSGQVRCGRCQEVFDAFSTLTSRLPGGRLDGSAIAAGRPAQPVGPERAEPPGQFGETEQQQGPAPGSDHAPFTPIRPGALASAPESEILTLPDELFGAASTPRRAWPWTVGCVAGLVALGAQAAWFFPSEIALHLPNVRPVLVQYCAWTGCRIALPRVPDLLFIEASDLQLLDPAHPNEVLLTATVRNRAAFEQALPLLELTLTDNANRPAARKVFTAAEYLGTGMTLDRGIGAGQEVSIRLYLDTGDLKPAGYRLYLFFT